MDNELHDLTATLEAVLADLDRLKLPLVAIRVSEAVDELRRHIDRRSSGD